MKIQIYHDLMLNQHDELMCCDGSNPRTRDVVNMDDVELFVQETPWYGVMRRELMAKYAGKTKEIGLCEGCYESIICDLLSKLNHQEQ